MRLLPRSSSNVDPHVAREQLAERPAPVMRDCNRHPSQSQPGGGVCASCLRERLVWLWRGESFRLGEDLAPTSQEDDLPAPLPPPEQNVGTTSSVSNSLQEDRDPSCNVDDAATTTTTTTTTIPTTTTTTTTAASTEKKKSTVIAEWAEFHALRRKKVFEQRSDSAASSLPMAHISRSLDSLEFRPLVERLTAENIADSSAEARPRSIPAKIRSRSMPLDNRRAEETALRVIREAPSDQSNELEFGEEDLKPPERRRSCIWYGASSPKWVIKLLTAGPARTGSRSSKKKVFPSRVGSRKRLMRFNSADWSHSDDPHGESLEKPKVDEVDGHRQRKTATTVLSWLQQDADRTKPRKLEQPALSTSTSGRTELWLTDLITVGHLHEIAEELEVLEESELESEEQGAAGSLQEVSSFGNFLLSAAERQPQAGLTRLSSAAAG